MPQKFDIATLGSNLGISALLEILQDESWTTKWYYNHWATHTPTHPLTKLENSNSRFLQPFWVFRECLQT